MKNSFRIIVLFCFVLLLTQQYFLNRSIGLNSVLSDGFFWVVGILTAGVILRLVAPRFSRLGILGLVLALLFTAVGIVGVSVVIIWMLSLWTIGVLLLRFFSSSSYRTISWTESILLGGLVWLGILGVLIHFPINFAGLYWGLCLAPFFFLPSLPAVMLTNIRERFSILHEWMQSIPFWAWVAGLALISWSLRWSSFPSLSFDDHSYHLRLWTELLTRQRALFDVNTQIWSVAPFAIDLLHAGLSLMAGTDARSALNLALAIMLLTLMARIMARLSVVVWVQWLLVLLMASTPMLGNLLLSLQTELMLAVVGLAGLRLVIDGDGGWRDRHVLGVLTCSALCIAIKLPGGVLGSALLASFMVRQWRMRNHPSPTSERLRWTALLMLIPLAFIAFHAYVLAWSMTGNPVFPLYNRVFLSPLFPAENFSDSRWIHGFSLQSYFRAFFKTSEFFESGDYTAGWQYLFLSPLSLIAVFRKKTPSGLRIALSLSLAFGLIMFAATQYWRYLFPVMPIATIAMAGIFIGKSQTIRTASAILTLLCISLNIVFFSRVSWMMNSPAQIAYTNTGKEHLTHLYAPVATLTEVINQLAPNSRVLYPPQAPYGATLRGSPLYVNWYAPSRAARFAALNDAQSMSSFLGEEKVDFAILSVTDVQDSLTPGALLREHLARYGSVQAKEGSFILYRLSDSPLLYREIFDLRTATHKKSGENGLLMPSSQAGIEATSEPKTLTVFQTNRFKQARYSVRLNCSCEKGFFIAQVNWDIGMPYYRLVACETADFYFIDAIPIPLGARQGTIYVTARDTVSVTIQDLRVELH
jgi:hypothetical protein